MMKKLLFLMLGMLLLIPFGSSELIGTFTQAQLDSQTEAQLRSLILNNVESDYLAHIEGTEVVTYYTMWNLQPTETEGLYNLYNNIYQVRQDYRPYAEHCNVDVPLELCIDFYWDFVVHRFNEQYEGNVRNFLYYQTQQQSPIDFGEGDIFG